MMSAHQSTLGDAVRCGDSPGMASLRQAHGSDHGTPGHADVIYRALSPHKSNDGGIWMKVQRCSIALGVVLGLCQLGMAQAPAGAPAGSTGQCKDGTYTSAPKKTGACRGHKGVQAWYAADSTAAATSAKSTAAASAPAAAPAPAPAAAPAAAPASTPAAAPKTRTSTANMAQAPGGGPGMVWLNTPTNVYHCPGSRYYGKTKEGKYMTEAQAKAAGAHPDHGKSCGM